jgi:hypothetical protein
MPMADRVRTARLLFEECEANTASLGLCCNAKKES